MKKLIKERGVGGDGVCDCSHGEPLNNKKPFSPFYIIQTSV